MAGTEIACMEVNYFNYLILTSRPWETTLKIDASLKWGGAGEGLRTWSNISREIGLIKLSKPRKKLIKLSIISRPLPAEEERARR